VHLNVVPLVDDSRQQRGVPLHPLAEHEERRLNARRSERIQHRGSPARVRPIIERQRQQSTLDATRITARLTVAWWA
jgi:hypothetical protein